MGTFRDFPVDRALHALELLMPDNGSGVTLGSLEIFVSSVKPLPGAKQAGDEHDGSEGGPDQTFFNDVCCAAVTASLHELWSAVLVAAAK